MTPSPSGLINLPQRLTELRETLLLFTRLLKNMIKDIDEQPDKKITKVRLWEGPEHRCFCPCGVGVHHFPSVDVFTNL